MFDSLQKVILSQGLLGHVECSNKGLKIRENASACTTFCLRKICGEPQTVAHNS